MDVETHNEQIARSFFATQSTGDLEKLRLLLHQEATWTVVASGIPGAGEKKGRKAIIDEFLGPIRGMFVPGEPKIHVDRIIAQGPFVAVKARGASGASKMGRNTRIAMPSFLKSRTARSSRCASTWTAIT